MKEMRAKVRMEITRRRIEITRIELKCNGCRISHTPLFTTLLPPAFRWQYRGTSNFRSGLMLEHLERSRGLYKRIDVCLDGCDSKDNLNNSYKWGLPRPKGSADVARPGIPSQHYLGDGDTLLQVV